MDALDGKDVLLVLPTNHKKNSTVRILKTPKTESRVRKIFLPKSVANMLVDWICVQDEMNEFSGVDFLDYNLPPVVSLSLRLNSVTYKLKLNGGDHSKEPVQYRFFGASYQNMF